MKSTSPLNHCEFLRHATIGAGAEATKLATKEYRAPWKLPRV